MKMTPLTQGSGVPNNLTNGSISSDAKARAVAIMKGQEPVKQEVVDTGNGQADHALKTIKMKTQVSTDRPIEIIEPEVQPTVVESPTIHNNEQTTQAVEETKPLSPQFAALAKAKRALQMERAALEKQKAELTQQAPNLQEYVSKADLKTRPLSVLTENGVTYDQLTEAILNGTAPNAEILSLKQEIQTLKTELSNQFAQRDQLQEQQVLAQMQRDANSLVENGDFKAIKAAKASSQVVELIHRTWKKTGEILDLQEAAQLVEKQLREEALPFVDILRPQQEAPKVQEPQTPPAPKPNTMVMKTLTNRDTATPNKQDRRSRAIAAFWQNNKG